MGKLKSKLFIPNQTEAFRSLKNEASHSKSKPQPKNNSNATKVTLYDLRGMQEVGSLSFKQPFLGKFLVPLSLLKVINIGSKQCREFQAIFGS